MFRTFSTSRRLWTIKEIFVMTELQDLFHLPPIDYRLKYTKGNDRLHNIYNYINENAELSQLFNGRTLDSLRLKMNRDATRVFGSESVNRSMNVPVTLKERDEIGEVIWNPIIYADYRIGWLLHHNDVTKIISDKWLSGCFSGVDASDLLKRNKMDKELFGNLLTSLGPTKGKFENFQ
ncbi:hypothetical protein P8452_10740 [Trifolium repens]|nr:hypothetical protein QL285_054470 [Trifolium repens]WJX21287.1 hypothetical protein P8452_10740 [Trifolium repens]